MGDMYEAGLGSWTGKVEDEYDHGRLQKNKNFKTYK